ncbi:hypothetical protein [Reyranella sp.]|jgi:hypothetical protein|uniref:hypothetical protein n=1 Tax=Reyranella sp. TaxID=1929291 RepID=UPI000BCB59AF|nr:hypothetical protein [Reyranella sp.]OYY39960.1 MAG: hypothetical protein B7Y57_19430 [Rhodospirillales bacterium 35-66-84]OYZ92404.1 MAG: hypothetical protein B7Y08_21900 [Rhodospirillales bacterium 24-66-33]OZB22130.1 MAG: hypothetical protein B7X63_23825 [Rhodospirillales bacterium 39-66-50]HQS17735.1 hypothetical protein [Reyranella sp.]HQT14020.1 hypothetical protein [Reyranella sp.]
MEEVMARHTRSSDYPVNGTDVAFPDHIITGREALTRSGNVPASEYQLILVRDRRTHLIGTDDELDLKKERGGALRAFLSDRSYGFTVDEVGQVWGAEDMEVDEFLSIWPPRDGHHWVLEREDEPDTVLVPSGLLSFGPNGVEDIVSRKDTHPDKVLVTVVTTAGTFPAEGAKRYSASTPIADVLADAARKLSITDTETWIVTVAGSDVNPTLTFAQAGLSGEVALEWGAREGGGGA